MKLLRDPLIHFLILGALLFAGHALWSAHVTRADRELVVDTREITRQSELFAVENGRPPSDAELQGIVLAFVEEEVLAREAVKLGLDEDDTIIRRRLAQKMRLLGEQAAPPAATDAELRAWFDADPERYAQAERRAVEHVFFSDEGRADAVADASAADLSDWKAVGDPFIVSRTLPPLSRAKLQQDYGGAFARAAFEAEAGQWSAPVRTPFGVHRLRVSEIVPRVEPDFASARAAVEADWSARARDRARTEALREMVERYDVVITE